MTSGARISGSCSSAAPWACRRPPTMSVRAAGARAARSETSALLALIREVHKDNYEAYGYRRMWKQLRRRGERVPRCQVQRIMREHDIEGAKRRGRPWRTTTPDPQAQRRPDLVKRDFTASQARGSWSSLSSPTCAAGRGWRSSRSCSTSSAARSSAGSSPPTCAQSSWSTRFEMALGTRNAFGHLELVHHLRPRQPVHQRRPPRRDDRGRRARLGRHDRRLFRQRDGRKPRRHLQDRADRRPRVEDRHRGRARDRGGGSAGTTTPACTASSATSRRSNTNATPSPRSPPGPPSVASARSRSASGSRGGCPPRLPQNRACAVRTRLFGTAGCDPRRRPVHRPRIIPMPA